MVLNGVGMMLVPTGVVINITGLAGKQWCSLFWCDGFPMMV